LRKSSATSLLDPPELLRASRRTQPTVELGCEVRQLRGDLHPVGCSWFEPAQGFRELLELARRMSPRIRERRRRLDSLAAAHDRLEQWHTRLVVILDGQDIPGHPAV
jgi:hypothetical protein